MGMQMILPLVLARTLSIYCEGHEHRVHQVSALATITPGLR